MASLTYLKSVFSTWILRRNPALRDFHMKHLRPRYIRFQGKRELSQWARMGCELLDGGQVRAVIAKHLREKKPYTAAKIGANEYFLLRWWMGEKITGSRFDALHENAGLFPNDPVFYRKYAEVFAAGVRSLDLLGLWTGKGEPGFYSQMGLDCAVTSFPHFAGEYGGIAKGQDTGWFPEMKGYRVMVVSSFADLMNRRANRESWDLYWAGRIPWPEPASIQAVPFPYGFEKSTQEQYGDSIGLLERFKATHREQMENSDLLLVGCGAYAIPILAWAKEHGKVAIHLGGDIQLLFGIKGGRWDDLPGLYNEHWVRPGSELTPSVAPNVENSCYW